MTIVKCPGHDFDYYTESLDASTSVIREWWICAICKLTVKTKSAAEYLQGKIS